MLRLVGCVFVIGGCTGIAGVMCRDLGCRLTMLKGMRSIYENMKYYISYQKASIPEMIRRLSEREKEPFAETFRGIYEEICDGGTDFPSVWTKNMREMLLKTPLRVQEKKMLLDFPTCLGFMEENAQARALDELLRELTIKIEELEGEQKSKNKMIMSLGMAGGIVLSIILL